MKNIKKIAVIALALLLSGAVVYATITIAKDRKSPKLSWQGTPNGHYDSSHNVGDTHTAQSRFSFVAGTTKGKTGIVKDSVTRLIWESKGSNGEATTTMNWNDEKARCTNLTKGGYNDWRLPTIKELASIVDYTKYNLAVNTSHFELVNDIYWSSTASAGTTSFAWTLSFNYGHDYANKKTNDDGYVLCVR